MRTTWPPGILPGIYLKSNPDLHQVIYVGTLVQHTSISWWETWRKYWNIFTSSMKTVFTLPHDNCMYFHWNLRSTVTWLASNLKGRIGHKWVNFHFQISSWYLSILKTFKVFPYQVSTKVRLSEKQPPFLGLLSVSSVCRLPPGWGGGQDLFVKGGQSPETVLANNMLHRVNPTTVTHDGSCVEAKQTNKQMSEANF